MHPLEERYTKIVVPKLLEYKKYASTYQIPKLEKVTVNLGVGDLLSNGSAFDEMISFVSYLTGQKPQIIKARKSISGFKIREGMNVGVRVTLRGKRMNDFLYKLIDVSIMRTRDFRGIKKSAVTAQGILNIGIKDSSIFPDLPVDMATHPIQINVSSTATTLEEANILYTSLGFVFQEFASEKKSKSKKRSHK